MKGISRLAIVGWIAVEGALGARAMAAPAAKQSSFLFNAFPSANGGELVNGLSCTLRTAGRSLVFRICAPSVVKMAGPSIRALMELVQYPDVELKRWKLPVKAEYLGAVIFDGAPPRGTRALDRPMLAIYTLDANPSSEKKIYLRIPYGYSYAQIAAWAQSPEGLLQWTEVQRRLISEFTRPERSNLPHPWVLTPECQLAERPGVIRFGNEAPRELVWADFARFDDDARPAASAPKQSAGDYRMPRLEKWSKLVGRPQSEEAIRERMEILKRGPMAAELNLSVLEEQTRKEIAFSRDVARLRDEVATRMARTGKPPTDSEFLRLRAIYRQHDKTAEIENPDFASEDADTRAISATRSASGEAEPYLDLFSIPLSD